jgi:hypothetical protein
VKLIPFLVGFWMLCAAVRSPGRALEILEEETGSEDGALEMWCNGKKLSRLYIRNNLRFGFISAGLIVGYAGVLPARAWAEPYGKYRYELDFDQMRRLIKRKKLKPKKRPGPKAKWRKSIPQVMRSREYQRLETDKERVALIRRRVAELPKQDRTIRLAIQRGPVRN